MSDGIAAKKRREHDRLRNEGFPPAFLCSISCSFAAIEKFPAVLSDRVAPGQTDMRRGDEAGTLDDVATSCRHPEGPAGDGQSKSVAPDRTALGRGSGASGSP